MDEKMKTNDKVEESQDNYSLEMVDTIFADTLSRGMQNAIISQQNAQMASSSSVTNACARILQAHSKPELESAYSKGLEQDFVAKAEPKAVDGAKPPIRRWYVAAGLALLFLCLSLIAWQYKGLI